MPKRRKQPQPQSLTSPSNNSLWARLSPIEFQHDLVAPEERQRPGWIVEGEDRLSSDGQFVILDVLSKLCRLGGKQPIFRDPGEADHDHTLGQYQSGRTKPPLFYLGLPICTCFHWHRSKRAIGGFERTFYQFNHREHILFLLI